MAHALRRVRAGDAFARAPQAGPHHGAARPLRLERALDADRDAVDESLPFPGLQASGGRHHIAALAGAGIAIHQDPFAFADLAADAAAGSHYEPGSRG